MASSASPSVLPSLPLAAETVPAPFPDITYARGWVGSGEWGVGAQAVPDEYVSCACNETAVKD